MPEFKKLLFGAGLMEPTLKGNKKITIRKYRARAHDFKKDEIFIGEFADGLGFLLRAVADIEIKTMKELKDSEAKQDLFKDRQDAFEKLKVYYPDLTWETTIGIIRYEVLKINGVPVVGANSK